MEIIQRADLMGEGVYLVMSDGILLLKAPGIRAE